MYVRGHSLLGEGYGLTGDPAEAFRLYPRVRRQSVGFALCSCGAASDVLKKADHRREWHRQHKEEMARQGAVVPSRFQRQRSWRLTCEFCHADFWGDRNQRFCGRSCRTKHLWASGKGVGAKRVRHRALPAHLAVIAATADEELATLIQEQHDDDVGWVRRPPRVTAFFDWMGDDEWDDPTARAALHA